MSRDGEPLASEMTAREYKLTKYRAAALSGLLADPHIAEHYKATGGGSGGTFGQWLAGEVDRYARDVLAVEEDGAKKMTRRIEGECALLGETLGTLALIRTLNTAREVAPHFEANTDVDPRLIPPGLGVYLESGKMYVWLVVDWPGDGAADAEEDFAGRPPAWFPPEEGWAAVLDVDWDLRDDAWMRWMLERGIAPGQRFLVELDPHWSPADRWSESEGDLDWHAAVVAVEPLPAAEALRRWAWTVEVWSQPGDVPPLPWLEAVCDEPVTAIRDRAFRR